MTDPFPELPRRVLYVDVTKPATKIANATKLVQRKSEDATKKKDGRGRPARGDEPMTSTERSRLRRAAKKADR